MISQKIHSFMPSKYMIMGSRYLSAIGIATWIIASLCACSKTGYERTHGELVGAAKKKRWTSKRPYGMSLVPAGTFTIGQSTYDPLHGIDAPIKKVSVSSFYMDETEITNREYRQFVNWVRDSIVRTALAESAGEPDPSNANGLAPYAYKKLDSKDDEQNAYYQYLAENADGRNGPENQQKQLDWSTDIIWDRRDYPSKEYAAAIEQIYLPNNENPNDAPMLDAKKLNYTYYEPKGDTASEGAPEGAAGFDKKEINIYPDTSVWTKDFNFSYNEPLQTDYFQHEAYSEYPVVGVNWYQANAFCRWRTNYKNSYQRLKRRHTVAAFRLPTEAEWEYAARGGLTNEPYPWGGPYLTDERGCFLANFKPKRGDYLADGAMYTAKARSYYPNQYNLYNMAGNVAEWTSSTYEKSSYYHYSSLNPTLEKAERANTKKVIRGGSWKDVGYYLRVSTRDFEYADSAHSYIGFRTVEDCFNQGKEKAKPTYKRKKAKS